MRGPNFNKSRKFLGKDSQKRLSGTGKNVLTPSGFGEPVESLGIGGEHAIDHRIDGE
jgi:hypothetical protein